MSHDELRDLLHRVVPEAPDPAPEPLVAAGRRSRTRRRAGAVVVAAAVVAAVAATTSVVVQRDDDRRPDTATSPTTPPAPTTTRPYDANTCPPSVDTTATSGAVDLDGVVSIGYCSTRLDRPGRSVPLTPEALVDVDAFAPAADSARLTAGSASY